MNNPQIDTLRKAILNSGLSAFEKYYQMTGGEWVGATPEYWYTSKIAEGISRKLPEFYVYLENSTSDFRYHSGAKAGRPSKRLNSGKADITLWKYWKTKDKYEAKCLIEVKRAWDSDKRKNEEIAKDIDRLKGSILESGKSISSAFLIVISDADDTLEKTAKVVLMERACSIKKQIETLLKNKPIRVDKYLKVSKYYKDEESMVGVLLFQLSHDKRKSHK